MLLSQNFTFEEMTKTQFTDLQKNNRELAKHPVIIRNLMWVCENLLQPIRDHYGKEVIVLSGFRSKEINKKISGGSLTSQHLLGEAVDIFMMDIQLNNLFNWIKKSTIQFGQLILESSWIHISTPMIDHPQKQCLLAKKQGSIIYYIPA